MPPDYEDASGETDEERLERIRSTPQHVIDFDPPALLQNEPVPQHVTGFDPPALLQNEPVPQHVIGFDPTAAAPQAPEPEPVAEAPAAPAAAPPRLRGGGSASSSALQELLAAVRSGRGDIDGIVEKMAESFRREGEMRRDTGQHMHDTALQALEQKELHDAQIVDEFAREIEDQERRLEQIDQQLSELRNTRFDANRIFSDRGLGTSMALGVAIGAMQQMFANTLFPGANMGNTAMALVQGAIDRDIRQQMTNFQQDVTSIGMQRTAMGTARQLGADRRSSIEFARGNALQWAAEQIRARASQTAGMAAREQMERMALDLERQAAEAREAALMGMAQSMAPRPAGTGRPRRTPVGQMDVAGSVTSFWRPADGVTNEQLATLGPLLPELANLGVAADQTLNIIDRMSAAVDRGDQLSLDGRAGLKSLYNQLTAEMKNTLQLGTLDLGVERLVNGIAADPTGAWTTTNRSQLRAQLRELRATTMDRVRSIGVRSRGLLQYDPSIRSQGREAPGENVTASTTAPVQDQSVTEAVFDNSIEMRTAREGVAVLDRFFGGLIRGTGTLSRVVRPDGQGQ